MKIVDNRKNENENNSSYGDILRLKDGSNYMLVKDPKTNVDYFLNLDTYDLIQEEDFIFQEEDVVEIVEKIQITLVID